MLAGEPLSQIRKRLGKYFSTLNLAAPITEKDEGKAERDGQTNLQNERIPAENALHTANFDPVSLT